jgi:hypothetical protein
MMRRVLRSGSGLTAGPACSHPQQRLTPLLRVALACLSLSALAPGLQATLAPSSFYSGFPGGRGWVQLLPPYNEHLIRDVGGLSLGLAVLTGAAALTLQRRLVIVTALAILVWSTPHLIFHLGHLEGLSTSDKVGQMVVLVLGVAAPLALLGLAMAAGRGARSTPSP